MNRIRGLLAAAAVLATVTTAIPPAAAQAAARPPGTAAPQATITHLSCTEISGGQLNPSHGWSEVWWISGLRCGFYLRPRNLCASRFGGTVYAYGGWVTSTVHSKAQCPSSHSQLQIFWQQVKFSANGAKHTCERYPSNQCPPPLPPGARP